VMHGHFVLLTAFFVESQPPAGAIVIVIIDSEFQYCAHTGEAVKGENSRKGNLRTLRCECVSIQLRTGPCFAASVFRNFGLCPGENC
jgi:hypothetical protein